MKPVQGMIFLTPGTPARSDARTLQEAQAEKGDVMVTAVVAILLGISGLHVYWAFGGRYGASVAIPAGAGGTPVFQPRPAETLAVAGLLGAAALMVLGAHGLLMTPLSAQLLQTGERVLGSVFLLRALGEFRYVGLFKRVRGTPFAVWDTRLFTPLCVVLGTTLWLLPF